MLRRRTLPVAAVVAALALAGAACSGDDDDGDAAGTTVTVATSAVTTAASTTVAATTTAATTTTVAPAPRYYLSLGDSYASGYQPEVGNTRNGFAYQVADASQTSPYPLELVNLGCAGATTDSVLKTKGCPADRLGPGATPYDDRTQFEAAQDFLHSHPGQVALVTISLGGNDVTSCATNPDVGGCVGAAVGTINANLPVLAQGLRAATGVDTLIVGTTYPDVVLGEWVRGAANGQQLATLSVAAFQSIINPALQAAYGSAGAQFVDVTAATGAYGPLTELTELAPYGSIPVPVAKVCELTYYCELQDIHPRPAGYEVIADLVLDAYLADQEAGG